jgi:hypothetical protein
MPASEEKTLQHKLSAASGKQNQINERKTSSLTFYARKYQSTY